MKLIIGGVGQGKLKYVIQTTGYTLADVAHTPEEAVTKPIFAGLEQWPDLDEEGLLAQNPSLICICNEVGCGVVPAVAEERIWREQVGRLCCRLAARATCVERIFCGLPTVLKGDGL